MKYQEIYLFFFFVNLEKCRTKRIIFVVRKQIEMKILSFKARRRIFETKENRELKKFCF